MGVQLLDRSGRTVRPTDAGEIYLRHAQRALEELEAGRRAVGDVQDLSSGALRLRFAPSFAAYLIGPLIDRFQERFPGISLTVSEMAQEQIESALGDDALDMGIAFRAVESEDIEWMPLHREQLALMVGQAHSVTSGQPFEAAALARYPLVLLSPSFATRQTVDLYMRHTGVRVRVAIEANSIAAIVEIVRRTGLATVLTEAVVIRLSPEFEPRQVALLQRRGGYRTVASRAFIALATDHADGLRE
jgi:LysR family cyn operon transcriptional activator